MEERTEECTIGEFESNHYLRGLEYNKGTSVKKRSLSLESKYRLKRIALNDITNYCHSSAEFRSSHEVVNDQVETKWRERFTSKDRRNEEIVKLLSIFGRRIQKEGALPRPDYFEMVQKSKQGPFTREMVAKWFFRVVQELKLSYNTAFLAIGYFDRFLSKVKVKIQFIPVLSRACLFVAAKFWECNPPSSKQLFPHHTSGFSDELRMLLKFEILLLQVLQWELAVPSAYDIFCACIQYFQSSDSTLATQAFDLLEKYITEYSMLRISPSTLAICSIMMALCRSQSRSSSSVDDKRYYKSLSEEMEKVSVLLHVTPRHMNEFQNLLKTMKRRIFCCKEQQETNNNVTSPTSITDTAHSLEHEKSL